MTLSPKFPGTAVPKLDRLIKMAEFHTIVLNFETMSRVYANVFDMHEIVQITSFSSSMSCSLYNITASAGFRMTSNTGLTPSVHVYET
jgi:hypothetical protein